MSDGAGAPLAAAPGFAGRWWQHPLLRNALAAAGVTAVAFALAHLGAIPPAVETGLYLVAIPLGSYHWAQEALERVMRGAVGIDALMLAAAAGACVLGLWDEAALLVVLYGAAEGLEEYTYDRTRSSIRSLLDLAPREAYVLRDGEAVPVPAASLVVGERFRVYPGGIVPTDGVIRDGSSSLDESAVTGESVPVDKGPGMRVFAGTLNQQGALDVEATAAYADNTLAKIIHLVEAAQQRKGSAQQWIERFGRRYSPTVLAVAALLVVVPTLIGQAVGPWATLAVVLLVAAAPCALVMSTPVAMTAGIGTAGRHGILIKGGAHLEHLGAIRVIAFDKTGTLTEGTPVVADLVPLQGSAADLLAIAAGVERFSAHPLARAIVERAATDGVAALEMHDFTSLTGAGAKATRDDAVWYVGSPDFFRTLGIGSGEQARVAELQAQGKTVILVGRERALAGLIALQDRIRPEAAGVVARLQAGGTHVVMMTGDNQRTAAAVGRAVGIADVRANLKPADKVAAVEDIERRQGAVLMVGDGVNDAPALAAATCGVAMGVAGSDAAIEAADVALMAEDLGKIEEAMEIGRRARRISLQNIIFSIAVLVTLIPSALLGLISITAAVVVHEVSELLAVANGLRLQRAARGVSLRAEGRYKEPGLEPRR